MGGVTTLSHAFMSGTISSCRLYCCTCADILIRIRDYPSLDGGSERLGISAARCPFGRPSSCRCPSSQGGSEEGFLSSPPCPLLFQRRPLKASQLFLYVLSLNSIIGHDAEPSFSVLSRSSRHLKEFKGQPAAKTSQSG